MIAAVLLALAPPPAPQDEAELRAVLDSITAEECRDWAARLAAPEMEGRGTPSPGLERAAALVEAELRRLGLEGLGEEGSFRVPYPLPALVVGPEAAASWRDEAGEEHELRPGRDFVPVPGTPEAAATGAPLFAGYAIDAPKEHWRDLAHPMVRGRVVFAFSREPRADDPRSRAFDGPEPTRHSTFAAKAAAAAEAGAVALVLVPDPAGFPDGGRPLPGLAPQGLPPRLARLLGGGGRSDRGRRGGGRLPLPVASVSRAVAEAIFATDLAAWQKQLDRRLRPRLLEAPDGRRVTMRMDLEVEEVQAFNLAARRPAEAAGGRSVVLGAHLDHVGWNTLLDQGRMRVFPGADDNASGSATLLEVAEALSGVQPRDDLVFLWFSGEELGLLGSEAWCRAREEELGGVRAMLNMDMVGRQERNRMAIGGAWQLPGWERFLKRLPRRARVSMRLDLDGGRDLFGRSDQASFARRGVRAFFFYEGPPEGNPDYHRPQDLPERLDGEKMERIGRIVAAAAWSLAVAGEDPERP